MNSTMKHAVGEEYAVNPTSIRFAQEMVEFNREQYASEYMATKLSIKDIGQLNAIAVNSETGLCEDGRHRVKACTELGIDVKCILVDGKQDIKTRLGIYNIDLMSGRSPNVAQKAIQAHKYALLTGSTVADCAVRFDVKVRNINSANTIAGLGRTDILDEIAKVGGWVRPDGGKPVVSLRAIASELRAESEKLKEIENNTAKIDYEALINTEKGKGLFWQQRHMLQNNQHEMDMMLVELLNFKYVLDCDPETGEVKC